MLLKEIIMEFYFKEQTVLITGATKGIGAAIAHIFEQTGASLLLTGTNPNQIDELNRHNKIQGKNNVRWMQVNFLNSASTERFLYQIEQGPPVHVLVNNAGTNRINEIDQLCTHDIDELIAINLRAPLLVCRSVSHSMKQMGYGRIVNIASIWSVITKQGRAVYSATKAGIAGMTKTIAVDLAPDNVLVNAVSPGFINTELTKISLPNDERKKLCNQVPLGRFAEPEEVAKLVLFLCSSENSYITGQNIVIDGGFTIV